MKVIELKEMTYEQCRTKHFKELMQKMQRKIDWWKSRSSALRPLDMASRPHFECSEAGMQYNFYKDALEALENHPKWISVEERLPEKTGKYIVCTVKKSVYCTRFETYHGGGDFMTDVNTHVTHWMPLPEPPKEEEQ